LSAREGASTAALCSVSSGLNGRVSTQLTALLGGSVVTLSATAAQRGSSVLGEDGVSTANLSRIEERGGGSTALEGGGICTIWHGSECRGCGTANLLLSVVGGGTAASVFREGGVSSGQSTNCNTELEGGGILTARVDTDDIG
jgi:hypothetical protein